VATGLPDISQRIRRSSILKPAVLPPLLMGFNAQVIQLILFRETMVLSNGSESSLGLCLAAWALLNGIGAFSGWRLKRIGLSLGRLFNMAILLMPLLMIVSIHIARIAKDLFDQPAAEQIPLLTFSLMAIIILGPVTILDGLLFVVAIEGLFKKKETNEASFVYGAESMGALVGGLVFTFILVYFMDPFTVVGLLLIVNALYSSNNRMSLFSCASLRKVVRITFLSAGAVMLIQGHKINDYSEQIRWSSLQSNLELKTTLETPYQSLAVLEYENEESIFGNGHLLFTLQSEKSAESGDWERSIFPNFGLLQKDKTENILLLGGGGKGYIRDILEYEPARIDWIEYDKGLVDLIRQRLIPEEKEAMDSPKVFLHNVDGRYFIKNAQSASFDLILLDIPDPVNSNINRYYTIEFFNECKRVLTPGGVLMLGLTCQPNYIGEDILVRNGSVYAALKNTFPNLLITPGTFSFMAAGKNGIDLTADPEALIKRYEAKGMKTNRFSPYLFYTWFEEDDLLWIKKIFDERFENNGFQVNRDDKPIAYYADAKLFTKVTGSSEDESLSSKAEAIMIGADIGSFRILVQWFWMVFPLLGLLFYAIAVCVRKRSDAIYFNARRLLLLFAAVVMGFTGIVLEMGTLFSFQNSSGFLYSQMGMLIAAYMAGLAIGALSPRKTMKPRKIFLLAIISVVIGVVGFISILPVVGSANPGTFGSLLLYTVCTILFGVGGGLTFYGIALALEGQKGASGGLIYTLDIIGACVGAWQASSIMTPLFGIQLTVVISCALLCFILILCILLPSIRR